MSVHEQTTDWKLPDVEASGKSAVVRTGPSGMVLGKSNRAEVSLRLFRPQGTRLFLAAPDYAVWLVAFRAMCLGAHISVVAPDHRSWTPLAEAITRCGGTVELLTKVEKIPGQGRPYRPSFVIEDVVGGAQSAAGPWQTIAVVDDLNASSAVHSLRNCDLALLGAAEQKGLDNVRRAYVLSQAQLRQASNLGPSDVMLALPRRLTRITMPPGPAEYRLLFNG